MGADVPKWICAHAHCPLWNDGNRRSRSRRSHQMRGAGRIDCGRGQRSNRRESFNDRCSSSNSDSSLLWLRWCRCIGCRGGGSCSRRYSSSHKLPATPSSTSAVYCLTRRSKPTPQSLQHCGDQQGLGRGPMGGVQGR